MYFIFFSLDFGTLSLSQAYPKLIILTLSLSCFIKLGDFIGYDILFITSSQNHFITEELG